MSQLPPSPPAPPAAANRERILEAAGEAFLNEGYRVGVDRIAARAGVAKQTLYNHFPSKEALFAEVVRMAIRSVLVTLETENGDLRTNLIRFATVYRDKVLCPAALAMFRTVVAEVPRFPELGKSLFAAGPRQTLDHLARFLERAMDRGELNRDDPRFAAELLTGMLTHQDRLRGLLNGDTDLLDDATKAERIVDCFLRAYANRG